MENQNNIVPTNSSIKNDEKKQIFSKKKLSQHQFFILQLRLFKKFSLLQAVILSKRPSAEKCDVCDKHGSKSDPEYYNFATIEFTNKKSGNTFKWRNVCPDCLKEAEIPYVSTLDIRTAIANNPIVLNINWTPFKAICVKCFQEQECVRASIKLKGLPFEVYVCKNHVEEMLKFATDSVKAETEAIVENKVPEWQLAYNSYRDAQVIEEKTIQPKKSNNKKKKNVIPEGIEDDL